MRDSTDLQTLIAMGSFSMVGNTPLVVQPMFVGALVERLGFSERQAGFVAAAELCGLTIGILAMLPAVTRFRRSTLAVVAVTLIVCANVAGCFVRQFEPTLILRVLSGLGAATAFCVFTSMAAAQRRPENAFASVNAIAIGYSGLANLIAPALLARGGIAGLLSGLSLAAILSLLTIPWLRAPQPAERHATTQEAWIFPAPLAVLPILLMMLLLYTGHGAIWSYQERIGIEAGLSDAIIGRSLGTSMLFWGVAGSLLARWSGLVIGRVAPQFISLVTSCIAVLVLVFAPGPAGFAISSGLIAFSWFYGLPYQMGLLAARDPKGRAALAGVMMSTGGMALGPTIAAFLVRGHAHEGIGLFACACYACALFIAVPSAKAVNQIEGRAFA